jgi:hypothetical protein
VRRSHDIDMLATLARAYWPDLLPSPFALAAISQWYVTTRYPDPDAVSPTMWRSTRHWRRLPRLLQQLSISRRLPPGGTAKNTDQDEVSADGIEKSSSS